VLASIGLKEVGTTAPVRFTDQPAPKASSASQSSVGGSAVAGNDTERSLIEAKSLYEKKLISEAEYEAMRKKILGLK
jgi:hypothetical protein